MGAEPLTPSPSPAPARVTFARRKWAIDALCEAYARDQLTVEELEERLDRANRARTDGELTALLDHLDLTGWSSSDATAAALPAERPAVDLAGERDERQLYVGIWSGAVRRGRWLPARRVTAAAFQGGVELDFREAVLPPGITEVRALAIMGGVSVVVPPGLPVETSGFALMGGVDDLSDAGPARGPDTPVLRIRGFALMGGVAIDVRLPGESPTQAKRRRRQERRNQR